MNKCYPKLINNKLKANDTSCASPINQYLILAALDSRESKHKRPMETIG